MSNPSSKTDTEWQTDLTPEQYRVTRQSGTERPFSGEYWNDTRDGVYRCVCCGAPLFDAHHKFASSCGWPSYFQPAADGALKEVADNSHGMQRTEIRCANCEAHLGHVFPDGPKPTGMRYCINSAALKLQQR